MEKPGYGKKPIGKWLTKPLPLPTVGNVANGIRKEMSGFRADGQKARNSINLPRKISRAVLLVEKPGFGLMRDGH
jgi:hypothetical protein